MSSKKRFKKKVKQYVVVGILVLACVFMIVSMIGVQ